ncbi:MAG TPA: hypothetical protein VN714_33095 [Trebonia sp.]|jgi:hypothetical protein|nr:hypothetical protein [Trebonia sp.]
MTVHTLSARPGRQDPETGAQPRPVPWRQMLWVTWRQHRGLLVTTAVVLVGAVAGMLAEGLNLHHAYAGVAGCQPLQSAGCLQPESTSNSDWHAANGFRVAVLTLPVLIALFSGPPVIARELENTTYRYAWTQGIGRVRWTAAKLAILAAALTIPAVVISMEFTWFFNPFMAQRNLTSVTPAVFFTRDLAYPAWTLTAFCAGAFLGTLLRRTLPAMAATLAAFALLAAVTWWGLRPHYPVHTYWPMQLFEGAWLVFLCAALAAGTIHLVRHHAA